VSRAQSKSFSDGHCCTTGESRFLQQIDLPLLDVTVVQAAHAAKQVAEFDQRDQRGVVQGLPGCVVESDNFNRSGDSSQRSASNLPLSQWMNPRTSRPHPVREFRHSWLHRTRHGIPVATPRG
jgi:hypothetical protein